MKNQKETNQTNQTQHKATQRLTIKKRKRHQIQLKDDDGTTYLISRKIIPKNVNYLRNGRQFEATIHRDHNHKIKLIQNATIIKRKAPPTQQEINEFWQSLPTTANLKSSNWNE
jgi:hypothetical protein